MTIRKLAVLAVAFSNFWQPRRGHRYLRMRITTLITIRGPKTEVPHMMYHPRQRTRLANLTPPPVIITAADPKILRSGPSSGLAATWGGTIMVPKPGRTIAERYPRRIVERYENA